jgi:hypothetical protein
MKIQRPKKFRIGQTVEEIVQYLELYLANTLADITTAMQRLTFKDNFQSFQVEVTLSAGQELAVRHNLGAIPAGKLIIRSNGAGIVDGDTAWTQDYVYLKNVGASTQTATVIFLR